MSDLHRKMMKLPAKPPPFGLNRPPPTKNKMLSIKKDYTPSMWNEYFNEKQDIVIDSNNKFRVYFSHPATIPNSPLIVLLHGGGFSALTWCQFTTEIKAILHCQVMAIDLRSHGDTITDNDSDLSAETLAHDVAKVLDKIYQDIPAPPIMIVGHSMGGAICVHISYLELIPTLIGCTVIDVVEGTAMEALTSMQSFLRSRPSHFKSIPNAIEWCVRSGQVRNVSSAKVSMPGQIINCSTGKLATNELPLDECPIDTDESKNTKQFVNPMSIDEDAELEISSEGQSQPIFHPPPPPPPPLTLTPSPPISTSNLTDNKKYTWRVDLTKSEIYWNGWFQGLSQKFLDLRVPKLLLLASIDGLDRTLTVGQMQGKFQMQVLARCGHAVHEDRPHEVAEVIASYMIRNKFAEAANDFVRHSPAC